MKNKIVGILICGLLIITCFPQVNGDPVEVIDQAQPEPAGYSYMGTTLKIAQSFKPTLGSLTSVELYLKRTATTGVVKVSINEELDGKNLTSVSLSISHVSTNWNWVKFDFDDIEVIPEKTYYIILYKDSSWSFDTDRNTIFYSVNWNDLYSRGKLQQYDYGSWWGVEISDTTFRTYGLDNKPDNPTINGKTNGNIHTSYNYTIQTTDSDQDDVKYYIDWEDNTTTITGLNESGKEVIVSHIWNTKGTYSVKVKAIDKYGVESDWTTLTVTMPCSYNKPILQFLDWLFQRFPHSFPILRQLMGY